MTPDPKKINEALRAHRKMQPPNRHAWIDSAWEASPHIEALLREARGAFSRRCQNMKVCHKAAWNELCTPCRLASTISQCLEGL